MEFFYLVAKGLDDTWGNERNSSRSIVPLLSYHATRQCSLSYSFFRMSVPCRVS